MAWELFYTVNAYSVLLYSGIALGSIAWLAMRAQDKIDTYYHRRWVEDERKAGRL